MRPSTTRARAAWLLGALCLALGASGCAAGAGSLGGGGRTLTIAIVSNSQMQDAINLSHEFEKVDPGVNLKFVSLAENEARAKITASVATGGGEFDVVMISNYETAMWAKNGWIVNLQPYMNRTPGYDPHDFLPTLRRALSYRGDMYSAPFYGESSFLMYNKQMFAQAGLTMPSHPTWPQVAQLAAKLDKNGAYGICLRGDPGWGEVLAPLDTVINAFGGRWYDPQWNAQLTSKPVQRAVRFYVNLVRKHGEPGAASTGFQECANLMSQGQTAMWYDATSAVSVLEDPATSNVAGKVGYAPAPTAVKGNDGWLYTWSLAIPTASKNRSDAWKFISWMTSKSYIRNIAQAKGYGPSHVPPGSRLSTYQLPAYKKAARAYAAPTLSAMNAANQLKPTVQPVPYTGVQFLAIPEFQDLGTRVSQQISAAIAGRESVSTALQQSQQYAQTVGDAYKKGS
jgi:sorbitol/mannitol transport system substrate-binding protein